MLKRRPRVFATALAGVILTVTSLVTPAHAEQFPDAYTQIVNHQIPVEHDGAPTYYWFGWGRHYAGPNGMEIRLTSSGTTVAMQTIFSFESAAVGSVIKGTATTLGTVVLASVSPPALRNALIYIGAGSGPATGDAVSKVILRDMCLGITVPNGGLAQVLDRAVSLMGAQWVDAFKGPYYNDVKVWFEPCGGAPSPKLSDTLATVKFPGIENVSPAYPISPEPPPPPPVPWNFENLDGDPGSIGHQDYDLGRQPALIQFGTSIHSFYHDSSNGKLRHAWADGTGWSFEILDGSGGSDGRISANLGGSPSAVVHGGLLHVFYKDFTNGGLRHGWSTNGTSWSFEHLDGAASAIAGHASANVGATSNAVVTPDGRLQVFYYDQTNGNLRHGWLNSTGWHFENLEGDIGSISHHDADIGTDTTSVVYNGILHLFYRDITNGNLRHAWDNSTGWHFENLDGDPGSIGHLDGDIGYNPSAVAYNGTLQLFYYDSTRGNLRHAWDNGTTGWQFEDLEGSPSSVSHYDSNVGLMPTATVLGGTLQLYYYEASGGNLRHAFSDATGWHFENLDGAGGQPTGRYNANVGWDPVAIPYNGKVKLLYFDVTNGNLRHAWSQ